MIRHIAIHIHSSIPLSEVQEALAMHGIHLREVGGKIYADRVPGFLRKQDRRSTATAERSLKLAGGR